MFRTSPARVAAHPPGASIPATLAKDYTISAWVYTMATDGERAIVNKYAGQSCNGWQM